MSYIKLSLLREHNCEMSFFNSFGFFLNTNINSCSETHNNVRLTDTYRFTLFAVSVRVINLVVS